MNDLPPYDLKDAAARDDPGDGYVLERQVGYILRKVHQRASEIFHSVMGGFEVTPTQFSALCKLADLGKCSQNTLGRQTAMDPATILGVISRLKKRGLVDQRLDPDDGRRIILFLTENGAHATAEMRRAAADVSRRTLEPLSAEEAKNLLAMLEKLQ